jgi:hypothetical protein
MKRGTKAQKLATDYSTLKWRVEDELRKRIAKSKINSEHVSEKCIKVLVFDYHELTVINDKLTFIDRAGLQYSLYCDVTLEDLLDIINK